MAIVKNKPQKLRYAAVGVFNTIIDFGLLFTFKSLGLPEISSNILSTTTSFVISFFLNKKYTFKTTDTNVRREIVLFVTVTLFGLWVIQSVVIWSVMAIDQSYITNESVKLFIAKLLATGVTLVWNYILYSRVVFKKS